MIFVKMTFRMRLIVVASKQSKTMKTKSTRDEYMFHHNNKASSVVSEITKQREREIERMYIADRCIKVQRYIGSSKAH